MKPLISIILLSYNSQKTIINSLESVRKSINRDFSIELIISDDCSTDETPKVIKKWLDQNQNIDIKIKFVSTSLNGGINLNLINGLALAQGEYIKILAADDKIVSKGFLKIKHLLELSPDIVITKVKNISDSGKSINNQDLLQDYIFSKYSVLTTDEQKKEIAKGLEFSLNGMFIKREVMNNLKNEILEFTMMEDFPIIWGYYKIYKRKIIFANLICYEYQNRVGTREFLKTKRSVYHRDDLKKIHSQIYEIYRENKTFVFRLKYFHHFQLLINTSNKFNNYFYKFFYILSDIYLSKKISLYIYKHFRRKNCN